MSTINQHSNTQSCIILGLAANGAPGTSPPTVSCNNSGKYRRDRRLGYPLLVGQIYIFWPDGQRDGQPVPYGGNTGCADFFAYLCSIAAVGIVGQSSHSAISIVTLYFADTLFGIILDCNFLFSSIFYPQFCPHGIHTHVDNREFIHRANLLGMILIFLKNFGILYMKVATQTSQV